MKEINPKEFSKNKTDLAGKVLANNLSSDLEKDEAISILGNWRASHSYPMHIFKKRIKIVSEKLDKNALSTQRLKRVPSILKKLNRSYYGKTPTMNLTQMQDIAGCRVIMSNIELARKLYEESYLKGDLKHKLKKVSDYITYPKKDGYRSIHLIYQFKSDKNKKEFNKLLVEIQIRSKLQHIWATAVETVDFFTKQAIKSNEGERDWVEFFKLVSSAFAKLENCPIVEGTSVIKKELYSQIRIYEDKLKVRVKMNNWRNSIKHFDDLKNKKNLHFFLLELDTNLNKLTINGYSKANEEKAIYDYMTTEKKIYGKREYDVVLVGADSSKDLKKAYPNYFLDTKKFLEYLKNILDDFKE